MNLDIPASAVWQWSEGFDSPVVDNLVHEYNKHLFGYFVYV